MRVTVKVLSIPELVQKQGKQLATAALGTVILFTLLALLTGCGERLVANKIESRVERRLPSLLGPADSYKVEVSGRTTKMISGRLSELNIHGRNVRLQPDLNVDDLVIQMRGVRFDTDENRLTGVEETVFEAALSEKCLTRFIAKRQPDLKELKIELKRGKCTVRTRPSLLGLSAGVALTGDLEVAPANKGVRQIHGRTNVRHESRIWLSNSPVEQLLGG
ncbi:MAG: DUF2993 domain-containing protein [Armatimonadota bacterium]|nr:DUF2993 domain-containing protein [Armatimonadota bacterium]